MQYSQLLLARGQGKNCYVFASDLCLSHFVRVQFVLQEFKGEKKISSESEYASIARELSHLLKAEIKESFKEINGTLKVA